MTTMLPSATERKSEYEAVKCPHCGRYCGAFVGKAQCKSCSVWVMVVPPPPPLLAYPKPPKVDNERMAD